MGHIDQRVKLRLLHYHEDPAQAPTANSIPLMEYEKLYHGILRLGLV